MSCRPLQWGHDEGVVEGASPSTSQRSRQLLQWGHDEGVVEGLTSTELASPAASFNGATTKVSWKALAAAASRRGCSCFNGATTKVSWKAGRQRHRLAAQQTASMGPRQRCRGRPPIRKTTVAVTPLLQWGHDNGVVEGDLDHVKNLRLFLGFNGATTKVSWKASM